MKTQKRKKALDVNKMRELIEAGEVVLDKAGNLPADVCVRLANAIHAIQKEL